MNHPTLDMFDQIAEHLLTQGRKCMEDGQCRYHDINGARCAIGYFISSEHYDPRLEGKGANSQDVLWAVMKSIGRKLTDYEKAMLHRLQTIHDMAPEEPMPRTVHFWATELSHFREEVVKHLEAHADQPTTKVG